MKLKGKKRYIIPILVIGVIGFGPQQSYPDLESHIPTLELDISEVEPFIAKKEAAIANLKPDNEARIIWADSVRKTKYSIVYLHGFSASPMEGAPIHQEVAKRYGCNLYIPRLAGHGLDDNASFTDFTPNELMTSAREAIAVGQILGEKVILMSCSTGGTLSIYLAAKNKAAVHSLIMYSPNIALYNESADMLTWPWGRQIGRMMVGQYFQSSRQDSLSRRYWTTHYHMDGVSALIHLLKETMKKEVFAAVDQPVFVGYFYKNEEEQDKVVSVEAIREFVTQIGTPKSQFKEVAFPDAGAHVITSDLRSRDLEGVRRETHEFMEDILNITPVASDTMQQSN